MSRELTEFSRGTFNQALRGCETEPFLSPGAIQPHGLLLSLDDSWDIVQVSVNVSAYLGHPPEALLGKSMRTLCENQDLSTLEHAAADLPCDFPLDLLVGGVVQQFDARLHRSEDLWLLELELSCEVPQPDTRTFYQRINAIGERLQQAANVQAMADILVTELRPLSGFDQVLIYRFDDEGHGEIIADDRAGHMPDYLGLRFPATDVPYQVRHHMVRHPLRMAPDHMADSVPLMPALHPLHGGAQDLSACLLRGTHRWCQEFYRNMRVQATLVIAVVHGERLWGYIACHHASVRRISSAHRVALQSLIRLFSALVSSKILAGQVAYERHLLALLDRLLNRINDATRWQEGLLASPEDLLALADSPGAALCSSSGCQVVGNTPAVPDVIALVEWLCEAGQPLYVSHKLSQTYTAASDLADTAAGVLAIALSDDRDRWLLWFRPEISQQIHWAGRPQHGLRENDGRIALSSRFSFSQWEEQISGSAEPFKPIELEAAVRLRTALYKRFLQLAEDQNRQMRARLAESQQRLATLLESLQDVVWSMALPGGEIEEISPSVENITGHSPDAFRQTPTLWWELIHPDDRSRVRHILLEQPHTGPLMFDFRIVTGDGGERWLRARAQQMDHGGVGNHYLAGVLNDITDRHLAQLRLEKALDAALAANQAKTTFLATMSHELRTPLNSIIGFSSIIRDGLAGPVSNEQYKQLGMVYDSAQHLLSLINEILDLSRIESGHFQTSCSRLAIKSFMAQILRKFSAQAQTQGVKLLMECADDIGEIHSDAVILRQIVSNLTANALKFTEQGEVFISCRHQGAGVLISVRDTGVGISENQLELIFEPFFQVDSGDQRRFQGTGLGLAISRRFAAVLGGEIRVSSQPGVGSEFSLWLPIDPEATS